MKVWVVIADTWNGEYSVNLFDSVWISKEAADNYVLQKNANRSSSYSTIYFVEDEVEVQGE